MNQSRRRTSRGARSSAGAVSVANPLHQIVEVEEGDEEQEGEGDEEQEEEEPPAGRDEQGLRERRSGADSAPV